MPSLTDLMCLNTTLNIVENPAVSTQSEIVDRGRYLRTNRQHNAGDQFAFNFISNSFQIPPVTFRPMLMGGSDLQVRNDSIALFQNQTVFNMVNRLDLNVFVEQDAIILDAGTELHDHRRGRDSTNSPDRTRPPTTPAPSGRRFVAYFHTHPRAAGMRPPTPASDWNPVPGVGVPGVPSPGGRLILHFMIESNKRIWGFLSNRRAFIVGVMQGTRLLTVDPGSPGFSYFWFVA